MLGDTYRYGPYCRNIRRVRRDVTTQSYLVDVEVDEILWAAGREEGYVCYPPLIDGGLQAFLYNLVRASDHLCIPRRIEHMTFLRAATGPRLTCHREGSSGQNVRMSTTRASSPLPTARGCRAASVSTTALPELSSPTSRNTSTSTRTREGPTCPTASTGSSGNPSSCPTPGRSPSGCRTEKSSPLR